LQAVVVAAVQAIITGMLQLVAVVRVAH